MRGASRGGDKWTETEGEGGGGGSSEKGAAWWECVRASHKSD